MRCAVTLAGPDGAPKAREDVYKRQMYVWERAFKKEDGRTPWWAKLGAVAFAAFATVATIGTGSAVQASAMTGIIASVSYTHLDVYKRQRVYGARHGERHHEVEGHIPAHRLDEQAHQAGA